MTRTMRRTGGGLRSCYDCVHYRTTPGGSTRMRFVSVHELRGRSADVWKTLAAEKELVVTSNGRPIALLAETSEERLEASLKALRRARAELAAMSMQQASLAAGTDRSEPRPWTAPAPRGTREESERRSRPAPPPPRSVAERRWEGRTARAGRTPVHWYRPVPVQRRRRSGRSFAGRGRRSAHLDRSIGRTPSGPGR